MESEYKIVQGKSIINNLVRKSKDRIIIHCSEYNSNGYEQKGELLVLLEDIYKGATI